MISSDDDDPEVRNRWLAVYVTKLEEEFADTKNTEFKCSEAIDKDVGLVIILTVAPNSGRADNELDEVEALFARNWL